MDSILEVGGSSSSPPMRGKKPKSHDSKSTLVSPPSQRLITTESSHASINAP